MQINLKTHNATELEFSAKVILTDALIAEIQKISSPDSDGDSPFFESYSNHRALVWVKKPDEQTHESYIEFTYEAKKGGKLRKKIPRISQLIGLLSSLNQQLAFDCMASFVFGKRLRVKSIVHLPQKYFELPDMPFDRIQGMHLVKLDGSETKYDVFLEVPTRGVITEYILYKCSSKIDGNLAQNILSEALKISDNFVVKE